MELTGVTPCVSPLYVLVAMYHNYLARLDADRAQTHLSKNTIELICSASIHAVRLAPAGITVGGLHKYRHNVDGAMMAFCQAALLLSTKQCLGTNVRVARRKCPDTHKRTQYTSADSPCNIFECYDFLYLSAVPH